MMKLTRLFLVALSASLFVSCSNDDDNSNDPKGVYDNGIFILNEGNGTGGGSVSFINDEVLENKIDKHYRFLDMFLSFIKIDVNEVFDFISELILMLRIVVFPT